MSTKDPVKPRIGITPWLRAVPTYLGERTLLYTLDPAYVDRTRAAGGLPLMVPRSGGVDDVLAGLDGLVLSGGGDLDPSLYGSVNEGDSTDVDPEADNWEIALLRGAHERGLPMLGICRGMQLMSIAFGGELDQAVDDHAFTDHPSLQRLEPAEILAQRHPIEVQPNTRLAEAYGAGTMQVNTIHHQAVSDAGSLRVSARTPTGVIEAVESAGEPWAVGVQWHPEKMEPAHGLPIFRQLVEQAAGLRASR